MSRTLKKRQSTIVVKPDRDADAYVLWDGVREEPFWTGTADALATRLSEGKGGQPVLDAARRLIARADESGTSLRYPSQTSEYLYGYQEDLLLCRGPGMLRRDDLIAAARLERDHEPWGHLVQPLTGNTN